MMKLLLRIARLLLGITLILGFSIRSNAQNQNYSPVHDKTKLLAHQSRDYTEEALDVVARANNYINILLKDNLTDKRREDARGNFRDLFKSQDRILETKKNSYEEPYGFILFFENLAIDNSLSKVEWSGFEINKPFTFLGDELEIQLLENRYYSEDNGILRSNTDPYNVRVITLTLYTTNILINRNTETLNLVRISKIELK